MKEKEAMEKLTGLGAVVENGSKHWEVRANGKWTTLTRHPSREVSRKSMPNILKQLGLEQ